MLRKALRHLTFANVVAVVALFIALGSTGAATPVADQATTLGHNVKKALRLSKRADKKATKALELATGIKAQGGKTGPPGPQGPHGPPGQVGPNTVGTANVIDGSLRSIDMAGDQGIREIDPNAQPAQSCSEFYWGIGPREGGGVLVLNPPQSFPAGLFAIATVGQSSDANPGYWYRVCNVTNSTLDAPDGIWTYKFFEP